MNKIKRVVLNLLIFSILLVNVNMAYGFSMPIGIYSVGIQTEKNIYKTVIDHQLNKIGTINRDNFGEAEEFIQWVDSNNIDRNSLLRDASNHSIDDAIKIIVDRYYSEDLDKVKKGTLEVKDSSNIDDNVCMGEYSDYIYTALAREVIYVASYQLGYLNGMLRLTFVSDLGNHLPFEVYPSFIYDSTQKANQPYMDTMYTLIMVGIYNECVLDMIDADTYTISPLEIASVIYMLDTGKYDDSKTKGIDVQDYYKGATVEIQNGKDNWRVRNDLIYSLNSIEPKWIMSFKEKEWKFVIVDEINYKIGSSGRDAIALCEPSTKTIYLGNDRYASNFGIPEHELAHFIVDAEGLYGIASTLYCVDCDALSPQVSDYSTFSRDEYFAECFKYLWLNRYNDKVINEVKEKAPLTYHVIYEGIINNGDDEVVIDKESVDDYVVEWYTENIGL